MSDGPVIKVNTPTCTKCNKNVFMSQKVMFENNVYHAACLQIVHKERGVGIDTKGAVVPPRKGTAEAPERHVSPANNVYDFCPNDQCAAKLATEDTHCKVCRTPRKRRENEKF